MHSLRTLLAPFFAPLVLTLVPAAQEARALRSDLELAHRAEVATRYARAAWPLGATYAGLPVATPLEGFRDETPVAEDGLLVRTWRRARDGAPAFVLESRVADDARAAQEQLLDWLAGVQSGARMPSTAEAGVAAGDAGFVGRSGARAEALAWIAFVRGNVAVRLVACDLAATPELERAPLARTLDQTIQRAALLRAGERPLRPAVGALTAPARARAGEVVTLALDAPAETWLQWSVGGSGQGYVERDRAGAWRLHTTGPGPLEVRLTVIGALGTLETRTAALSVDPE